MARPTLYREEYIVLAKNYCLLGATNEKLAECFGVAQSTVQLWRDLHEEFDDAIREGKEAADGAIAASLFKRAEGYDNPEVHVSNYKGDITLTDIDKHYPGDVTAQIFWLKNRQPELWRDKKEVGVSGNLGVTQLLDEIDGTESGLPEPE